jgi:dipeptidyl aminopeptidase
MNAYELRPPRMDDSGRTKYPVLFKVYGGPGSTQTEAKFNYDWHAHLVSEHQYIVVVVDGRGTGYRGRKFRSLVRGNLGKWEVDDQIAAAKIWAGKSYVDDKRIGIWGWSYGGFMAAKTVERGAGVHTLGMSVAPVTTWELYGRILTCVHRYPSLIHASLDSIYTERYMGLPEANRGGYDTSSVHNMTAFHTTPYLLAHGSGDDNVHFANSAHLLDMFTQQRVRGFRFRMFTDSDHSMGKRGAYREVYEFLEEFLVEKWGVGAKRRGW